MEAVLNVSGITPIFLILLAGFIFVNSIFGLILWTKSFSLSRSDRSSYTRLRGENSSDSERLRDANFCAFPITIHYVSNVIAICFCIIFMIATIVSYGDLNHDSLQTLTVTEKILRWSLVLTIVVNVLTLCFAIYGDLSVKWGRRKSVAWGYMMTLCVFIFALGVSLVVLNEIHGTRHVRWVFTGYQAMGFLLVFASVCGIFTVAYTPSMALDVFVVLYNLLMIASFACAMVFAVASISEHGRIQHKFQILLEADMVMALIAMLLFFTSLKITRAFGARSLPSGMSIKVLDVLALSDEQKAQWASGINNGNGTRHIGAWDGAGAIEMMKAYSRRGVPDIGGIALHIRRPAAGTLPEIETGSSAHSPDEDSVALVFLSMVEVIDLSRFVRVLACLCGRRSLFKWLVVRFALVGFHWPFTTGVFLVNYDYTPPTLANANSAMQFAASHRSSRKMDRRTALTMAVRATVEYNHSLPSWQRAALLLAPAMDTEPVSKVLTTDATGFISAALPHTAIVDLRPHKGKTWDEYLHSLKKGNRREFDKAFYAMGGSIHYINENGKFEEAASAASASASASGSSPTSTMFYHNNNPYEVHPAFTSPAPASALTKADRDHDAAAAATLAKYQDRDALPGFGSAPEALTPEATYPGWNNDFYDLWLRIAQHRISQGDSPCLYDLTPQMFSDVANMHNANRSFMLLRLDGQPIGSSVLFQFPKSRMLTCDMQGLDHARGRQAKAYFIMLYRSVRLALEQGYDFVDFGPTTLGPKTDAGATLFPCSLGLYATDPMLRIASRLCVSAFASYQADVSDPMAATANVATIVDDGAAGELVVEIVAQKAEVPQAVQSEEDIEVLMAMDPATMTGSQKKRYNKEKKKRAQKAAKARISAEKQGKAAAGGEEPKASPTAAAAAAAKPKGPKKPSNGSASAPAPAPTSSASASPSPRTLAPATYSPSPSASSAPVAAPAPMQLQSMHSDRDADLDLDLSL